MWLAGSSALLPAVAMFAGHADQSPCHCFGISEALVGKCSQPSNCSVCLGHNCLRLWIMWRCMAKNSRPSPGPLFSWLVGINSGLVLHGLTLPPCGSAVAAPEVQRRMLCH